MVSSLNIVLQHERKVVRLALMLLVILAWGYLYYLTKKMGMTLDGRMAMELMSMNQMNAMSTMEPSALSLFISTFVMWAVMMVGMMLPSAAPMILLFCAVRKQNSSHSNSSDNTQFISAYLSVWTLFSLIVSAVHLALLETHYVSDMMVSNSTLLSGALLLLAGVWHWTPWKQACLKACRGPAEFIAQHYRPGRYAAFNLGLRHGAFCVGCCWAVMLLLFVAGVMNLMWIALITLFVLAEKVLPHGRIIGHIGSILMIGSGTALLILA